jgi:two-component system, NtrC family, response regulator AtoC
MAEFNLCRPEDLLIGHSTAIHRICDQLRRAAPTELPVLITGESGTGKDLAAKVLHDSSAHRTGKFMKLSCPTILDDTFQSTLFGYEKNSSAWTSPARTGQGGPSDRGTLFLDKIDELDLALQPKLLYALQDSQAGKLDSVDENLKDVRLICATGKNLEANVIQGTFRSDLYYRINVVNIRMPPLREHLSDIPILMDHFIRIYADRFGGKVTPLSPACFRMLMSYYWPGNIRELENVAKRFVILGGEEHIFSAIRQPDQIHPVWPEIIDLTTPLRVQTKRALRHLERKIILGVLEAHKWNRRETARSLDISYRALLYKIKEADLSLGSATSLSLSNTSLPSFDKKPRNKCRN